MPNKRAMTTSLVLKWTLAALMTYLAVWTVRVAPDWQGYALEKTVISVCLGVLALVILAEPEFWWRLAARTHLRAAVLRVWTPGMLLVVILVGIPAGLPGRGWAIGTVFILVAVLFTLTYVLKDRAWAGVGNLAVTLVTMTAMLIFTDYFAPVATDLIADQQHKNAVQAAWANARSPLSPDEIAEETQQAQGRSPQSEMLVEGEGAPWGEYTGWGTRTNAVMRYWMDGVYDVEITYNSMGFRGPEIPYGKPEDTYRILIVGDSFVEAREVAYEETFYARLSEILAQAHTPDGKRIEVFAVGAVGWGTVQAYLYYHNEGWRFMPDLVIHTFFINDVVDNHPTQFYANSPVEFYVPEDYDRISLYINSPEGGDTGERVSPEERGTGHRWLSAWPSWLAKTNTADLLRRVIAPPRETVTLASVPGSWHPQNFIFVRFPEVEGYEEAWRRTRRTYEIWDYKAWSLRSSLMVLAIGYPEESVTEMAATFVSNDDQEWVWDADLPYTRLAEILSPLDVPLILTRDAYNAYAESVGQRASEVLFFVDDGHLTPTGHQLTAKVLYAALLEQGIVTAP